MSSEITKGSVVEITGGRYKGYLGVALDNNRPDVSVGLMFMPLRLPFFLPPIRVSVEDLKPFQDERYEIDDEDKQP